MVVNVTNAGAVAATQTIYTVPNGRTFYLTSFTAAINIAAGVNLFLSLFGSIQGVFLPTSFGQQDLIVTPAAPYIFLPGELVQLATNSGAATYRACVTGYLL
jgi:hypothetical protein